MLFKRLFSLSFQRCLIPRNLFLFSAKKILSPQDIPMKAYAELGMAINACHNCKMMADLLKSNLGQMSDYQLSFAVYQIFNYDLELDEHFYSTILPIVKEFVKNMGRENNRSLAEIVSYMGWLRVQDDDLWKLFEQKLIAEKLYRYLSIEQLIDVTSGVSTANRGNSAMFEVFEKVFIKHRLALVGERAEMVRRAFEQRKLGSQLLFKVLENPRAEVEVQDEKKAIEHNKH